MKNLAFYSGRAARALLLLGFAACADGAASVRVSRMGDIAAAPGVSLHYRILGQGSDTIVLVSGGALPARYFESAMSPLARAGHVLVAYDLRGRGASSPVTDTSIAVGLDADVADLEQLRAALKIDRLKLVGDHLGAVVAAAYAVTHPQQVERVAMIAPSMPHLGWAYQLANYTSDPGYLKRYLAATGAHADSLDPVGFCREFWPFYLSPMIVFDTTMAAKGREALCSAPADQLRRIVPLANRLANSAGVGDVRERVKGIRVPVLLMAGFGNVVYAAMYDEWKQVLPDAQVDSVGSSAMFPWLTEPARTIGDLDRFLRGGPPAVAR